jgi:hypothetical protein
MINEIKKEMEQDLYGINVHRWADTIELHYSSGTFRNKFKDYKIIQRHLSNTEYHWDVVSDLGDGITAICLLTDEEKEQWEAELDVRRTNSQDSKRSAS